MVLHPPVPQTTGSPFVAVRNAQTGTTSTTGLPGLRVKVHATMFRAACEEVGGGSIDMEAMHPLLLQQPAKGHSVG